MCQLSVLTPSGVYVNLTLCHITPPGGLNMVIQHVWIILDLHFDIVENMTILIFLLHTNTS